MCCVYYKYNDYHQWCFWMSLFLASLEFISNRFDSTFHYAYSYVNNSHKTISGVSACCCFYPRPWVLCRECPAPPYHPVARTAARAPSLAPHVEHPGMQRARTLSRTPGTQTRARSSACTGSRCSSRSYRTVRRLPSSPGPAPTWSRYGYPARSTAGLDA